MKADIEALLSDYRNGERAYDKPAHDRLVAIHGRATGETRRLLSEADRVWSGDFSQTRVTHYLQAAAAAAE